ncbi:MAG: hypothetical protein ACLR6T_01995 [Intestinibacter sp.]
MTEKEKKYREVNNDFTEMTCVFYEHMREDSERYSKEDVNKCITKLIKSLCDFRKMK